MHTSRKNLFLYLPILILFLTSFIWVLKAPDHFSWSADLYLRNDDTSVLSQLFYSDNDELSQDNSTDGTRDGNIVTFSGLPDLRSLTLFRFDPTNTQESYRVTHVGFFLNGEAFFTMEAADLEAQAFPVNASWQLNGEELVFTPQNSDSSFLLSADSIREAAKSAAAKLHVLYVRQRFFLALSIALLLCVLLFFRNGIASYLKMLFLPDSSGHFDWFALISTAVIAGALLVVCIIGLFSALGLHPDEWDVKACLDYGIFFAGAGSTTGGAGSGLLYAAGMVPAQKSCVGRVDFPGGDWNRLCGRRVCQSIYFKSRDASVLGIGRCGMPNQDMVELVFPVPLSGIT